MTLRGNPTFTFNMMKQLRVQIVRINLNWNDVAKRRPAHPQDPADPAYDWSLYDRAIRYADQNGIRVMLSILFTPAWANGGRPRNVPPRNYNDLRNFSYAAATRYSGKYIPNTDQFDEVYLPAVKHWTAWNEPSNPNWLQQTVGRSLRQSPLVRADLHRGLAGRALHELRRGEGCVRSHGPARQQRGSLVAAVHLAAELHADDPRCRPAESRRVRAQSVLRQAERDTQDAPERRCGDARKHQHAHQHGEQAVGQEAHLDHRVRLADAAGSPLRRLVRASGCLRASVLSRSRERIHGST